MRKYLPFEVLAFLSACVCIGVLFYRWYLLGFGSWVLTPLAAIAGLLAADVTSGFVHWWMDTWGTPETPFFGEMFIRDFRVHHTDQQEMTRHGFFETNGNNAIAALLVLVPSVIWTSDRPEVLVFLILWMLGILFTNQIHKWAHQAQPPVLVMKLQSWDLILSPSLHARHHAWPYTTYYNITTGWLNFLIVKLRIYSALERGIVFVTGWKPRP
jgi:ubiquitin-conjugating enzyme E2 variant